jgi:hypothetical protein
MTPVIGQVGDAIKRRRGLRADKHHRVRRIFTRDTPDGRQVRLFLKTPGRFHHQSSPSPITARPTHGRSLLRQGRPMTAPKGHRHVQRFRQFRALQRRRDLHGPGQYGIPQEKKRPSGPP